MSTIESSQGEWNSRYHSTIHYRQEVPPLRIWLRCRLCAPKEKRITVNTTDFFFSRCNYFLRPRNVLIPLFSSAKQIHFYCIASSTVTDNFLSFWERVLKKELLGTWRDVALDSDISLLVFLIKPQQQGRHGNAFLDIRHGSQQQQQQPRLLCVRFSLCVCVCLDVIDIFIFFSGNGWRSGSNVHISSIRSFARYCYTFTLDAHLLTSFTVSSFIDLAPSYVHAQPDNQATG